MIGLQLVLLPFLNNYWLIVFVSIIILLIARMISISVPAFIQLKKLNVGNLKILAWAGRYGGISIAMALSIAIPRYREVVLSCFYFIVVFSVVVQWQTLGKVVNCIEGA